MCTKFQLSLFLEIAAQILPPILILPLSFVPFDLTTILFFVPVFVCCFISLFGVVKLVFRILSQPAERNQSAFRLLRPILTIFSTFLVFTALAFSYNSATTLGRKIATSVQLECDKSGSCPKTLPSWRSRNDAYTSDFVAGEFAKYLILYRVEKDQKAFRLYVKRDIDSGLSISGGVSLTLHEQWKE